MMLLEKLLGRDIIHGGMKQEGVFSESFSLFFYLVKQHSPNFPAVKMGLHSNGQELASGLPHFKPFQETPHHRKPHRHAHVNRDEGKGQTGFEPGGNQV